MAWEYFAMARRRCCSVIFGRSPERRTLSLGYSIALPAATRGLGR